ncbi:hypothetical protein AVEN_236343-1 [Araneus ventricosus]|uniref:Mariner Mos1 transposase n=1 Tax=Araneus ventricosus TaxID=182803 RepID=A0A4Y2QYW9_ARAVE|nr:hypothetical protein AVEN_236343-1 [Araneus ventricosus]
MEWRHSRSPQKKSKQRCQHTKLFVVFWDRQGILLVESLPRGETINAVRYCETLRKVWSAIQNKRRGMLSQGIVFLFLTHNSQPTRKGVRP